MSIAPAPDFAPPRACTTAAAIRTEAVEPSLELVAIESLERKYREQIAYAVTRLQQLAEQRVALAQRIAGFVDHAAERLDYAERHGSYDAVREVSELPNSKEVGGRINAAIDCLKQSERADEHQAARMALHAIFETFGRTIFEGPIAVRVGKGRRLTLEGEYRRWAA
jgi:hypothetical protein